MQHSADRPASIGPMKCFCGADKLADLQPVYVVGKAQEPTRKWRQEVVGWFLVVVAGMIAAASLIALYAPVA